MKTIHICVSCTKINAGEENTEFFRQQVAAILRKQRPDLDLRLEPSPCLKVCPIDKITFTVTLANDENEGDTNPHLTMSREATAESLAAGILSFFRPTQA